MHRPPWLVVTHWRADTVTNPEDTGKAYSGPSWPCPGWSPFAFFTVNYAIKYSTSLGSVSHPHKLWNLRWRWESPQVLANWSEDKAWEPPTQKLASKVREVVLRVCLNSWITLHCGRNHRELWGNSQGCTGVGPNVCSRLPSSLWKKHPIMCAGWINKLIM